MRIGEAAGIVLSPPAPLAVPCPPAPTAPSNSSWTQGGRLQDPRIDELSGVAPSHAQPGVLWVHNDSGDRARVFAIGLDGATRAVVTVEGVRAIDWEDVTIASGPDGRDWVWAADVGDNRRIRATVQLYGFPEPDVTRGDAVVRAQRIDVTYPSAGRHDVETYFVDPVSGDGYLITKEQSAPGLILRLPRAQLAAGSVAAELVGQLPPNMRITAGDIRRDGAAIVLRDYGHAYAWTRQPGETIAGALARTPVRIAAPDQSEAIAWLPGGRSWVSIPEGRGAPTWTISAPQ